MAGIEDHLEVVKPLVEPRLGLDVLDELIYPEGVYLAIFKNLFGTEFIYPFYSPTVKGALVVGREIFDLKREVYGPLSYSCLISNDLEKSRMDYCSLHGIPYSFIDLKDKNFE